MFFKRKKPKSVPAYAIQAGTWFGHTFIVIGQTEQLYNIVTIPNSACIRVDVSILENAVENQIAEKIEDIEDPNVIEVLTQHFNNEKQNVETFSI